jgi:hypothetical protein
LPPPTSGESLPRLGGGFGERQKDIIKVAILIFKKVKLTYFCITKIKSGQISFFLGNMLYFCRPQNNGVITLI